MDITQIDGRMASAGSRDAARLQASTGVTTMSQRVDLSSGEADRFGNRTSPAASPTRRLARPANALAEALLDVRQPLLPPAPPADQLPVRLDARVLVAHPLTLPWRIEERELEAEAEPGTPGSATVCVVLAWP